MTGQLRLLGMAYEARARPRLVVLSRSTREEILLFSIVGGLEKKSGIFVAKVQKESKASEAGLMRGDQVGEFTCDKKIQWKTALGLVMTFWVIHPELSYPSVLMIFEFCCEITKLAQEHAECGRTSGSFHFELWENMERLYKSTSVL